MADSMTVLRLAGPAGVKRNLVVMGDGFTAADQGTFNSYVQTALMEGVFGRDYFSEDASAYNIYRINLESVDSGVSQRRWNLQGTPGTGDDTILTDTTRDTALGIIFNAEWSHCWLEYGGNSEARITAAINTWVPDANNVLIVLNEPGFGGCGGGGRAHVTLGVAWDVIAHEFGHGIGGFADEYSAGGAYTGADLGWINVTTVTDRATTRWRQFIDPATPLPTGVGAAANYNQGPRPPGWSSNFDVGLFEGGNTQNTGIYRPVENCRMNGNTPEFCPVCYTSMKTARHAETAHRFDNAYAGNFYGSGRSDVLLHHGTSIQLFRNSNSGFTHAFSGVESVPGSWQFAPSDQVFVGDFNGDGVDEVVIFNSSDWVMPYLGLLVSDGSGGLRLVARYDGDIPGWGGFARNDRFHVADLDGDGRDDLVVFNGDDWSMTYVGLLRSTGFGFFMTNRYDGDIPGWGGLARHDKLFVADLDGNGTDDLVIFNGEDWAMAYVGLFQAGAGGYAMTARHDGDIPGWGGLARNDKITIGDFDGNGLDDVFIFNGDDWSMPYLGMFRSTGPDLTFANRFDGDVPGWGGLARHDSFIAADFNADGRCDLWAWNHQDWNQEYLGRMASDGTGLSTSLVGDWVGEWNLSPSDHFEVARFSSSRGKAAGARPHLYVHNNEWFGVINGRSGFALSRIYYRWIHDYRFGRNW